MVYYRLGEVIRELRERLQLTQEELAEGICSVSSIAKIEGGSQMPSGRVAEALLRRLKDSGCFFTGFSNIEELEELKSWDRVLARARTGKGRNSQFEEQFFSYVRIVEHMKGSADHAVLLLELMQALVISMPLDELYDADRKRRTYTYLELYILNSIAVQFFYMESLDAAERILERVYCYLQEWQMDGAGGRNLFPAVCNNLAAVRLAGGSVGSARELCRVGIRRCVNAGLLLPLPSLFGNLSNVMAAMRDMPASQLSYSRMRMLQELIEEAEPAPVSAEVEFMRNSYLVAFVR